MVWAVGERLRSNLASLYHRFLASESAVLITMALLVGLGGGFGAVVFRELVNIFSTWSFEVLPKWLAFLGSYYVIIVPAIGGLFVGLMFYYLARQAKKQGVPEVIEAVALRGGRIPPIAVVFKALASAISIGTGGSVGWEEPIVLIGSASGSTTGQVFKLSDERIRNLVACGAAAGISATFNAPIAGVIFALEVILGEFSLGYFSTVVIASVMASIIGRIYFGNAPAFLIPPCAPAAPLELPLYILLGIIAGVVGVVFIRMLYWLEDLFSAWRFPEPFKPMVGGLVIGTMGLYFPQLFGVGYKAIGSALHNLLAPETMLFLCVLKVVATSLTIGSGGSGGVFAPSLFIGSMLGGTFGWGVYRWLPLKTALPGAYSLVGMAAVFSAVLRAPITSILLPFEMTQDYNIILPLMFASVVSILVAGRLEPENIYTLKLKRKGVDVRARKDLNLMRAIMVEEAMTPISQFPTVNTELPLPELARIFQETFHHGLPVLDEKGELYGVVTLTDLERAMETGLVGKRVRDICTRNVRTAFPDESLEDALRHFGALDVGRIPVVERANPKKLLGMLRRGDIIRAYSHALLESQARLSQREKLQLEYAAGTKLVEVELSDSDAAVGKTLRELVLPEDSLIISIRRGRRVVVPRGDTILLPGDLVIALTSEDGQEKLKKCLSEG